MSALIEVILPVFFVTGFGYLAVWRGWFSDDGVEGLMRFTQGFAIPCLLFSAIANLDLEQNFNPGLLLTFYAGALSGFAIGTLGARLLFGRDWEDSIAIGFCGLFSNSVLLGLPITERAYGDAVLQFNYAIIAVHAPFCYAVGITAMEVVRNRGSGSRQLLAKVSRAMFRNSLIVGIGLGFLVNLTNLPLPAVISAGVDLMARAALPAALFGLGGILVRYRPEGDMRTVLFIVAVSLLGHPVIAWLVGPAMGLSINEMRAAVLTAAMAPGVNAYIFANMYGRAKRVAASAVLLATGLSVLTAWGWLAVLG